MTGVPASSLGVFAHKLTNCLQHRTALVTGLMHCHGRPYVLPQAFVYPLVDSTHLGIEKPEGMVFVKLIEATNVPRMDLFSESDPYVKWGFSNSSKLTL